MEKVQRVEVQWHLGLLVHLIPSSLLRVHLKRFWRLISLLSGPDRPLKVCSEQTVAKAWGLSSDPEHIRLCIRIENVGYPSPCCVR